MTIEILVVREPRQSPIAELCSPANAHVLSMVKSFHVGKENHTILKVELKDSKDVLRYVNAFQSVIRAWVCK